MGARQSKRSVDITTTPKKEGVPAEGGVVGDAAAPGDGKLERIEEADTKPTTNGIAPHTESAEDKEKDKDEATEKDKEQQPQQEEVKAEETKQESSGDSPAEVAEVTTPTEATPASPNTATSPDNKEAKKKEKKKKWSFRSISFSKKDKTKPSRDETPKNGDVTKEEPLAEGGEDAENATAATSSPVEEKSAASSPSADEQVVAPTAAATAEPKEEAAAASPTATAVAASPVEEKKKEPTPSALTPVPSVEDKKEEAVEKVEAEKKVVEVSQSAGGHSVADPVEIPVYRVQPVATPSIIERKASEDLPSLPPSSPPPTPIDPSPLQQARQAAANATALAEALKLPAVAADKEESTPPASPAPPPDMYPSSREDILPQENRANESITTAVASPTSLDSSTDNLPSTEATFVLAEVECLPVVEAEIEVETSQDIAKKIGKTLGSSWDNKEEVLEVDSDIAMKEKVFKCQKSEANSAKETPSLAMECDKNTQSKGAEKVSDIVAVGKIVNEASPIVECQTESEINNCEVSMKINVLSNVEHIVEAETLSSTEIETKDAYPAVKQYLSSENVENLSDETQHIKSIEKLSDSDLPSIEKCVSVDTEKLSEVSSTLFAKSIESSSRELEQSSVVEVVEQSSEIPIEYEHDYAKLKEIKEEEGVPLTTSPIELFINSEEGPLSVSEDILVEARPALIIPEDDSVEELTDTTESVKVIPETDEEKLEIELESDTALPTEETLISEELEDMFVPENATVEPLTEFVTSDMKNEMEAVSEIEDMLPCPPEDLTAFSPQTFELQNTSAIETEPIVSKKEKPTAVSTSVVETEPFTTSSLQLEQTEEIKRCLLSSKDRITSPEFCPLDDIESMPSDAPTCSLSEKHLSEPQTLALSPEPESVPISLEDLPPAPEDTGTQSLDSFDYPLPPEELSCPLLLIPPANMSVAELPPAPVEHAANPRDPTETLLTPPLSPNFQQSSVTSGIATETATKDRSQIPSYDEDDSSNREQSMLLSEPLTMSCDQSNIELKERLATECVAKTESQEEALSCQLSNSIPSTAAKEHHQNAPEVEAPVENNVTHDASTTESADEAPKVAPPAVPTEAPASPPTAPAITEDVASVTKAIEEIDISDKAVAAAVNEAIECNTNEIIADAHHQNNINE
ncbi:PREDICTED: nascent polypeptide-associated complex subunit alpha, muscle-specific form-like [Atta colombica]|uniref:nascent polypeptide-associated complex subunit alpha, muscle-specific form-like n=1 Tax=Atta colombica TaxID=520822 RepID=UPI00084CA43E|nr:PREDICTED: nascent polypeptide-associated complex subunit alpha, muscle-specific form-like [Atta colombica]